MKIFVWPPARRRNEYERMFDEEEPGKPKNWGWTIAIIAMMMVVNLTIFVVCRVLLDSENEFDEPILQGRLRDNVTMFLGIFAMTFCFGCCCCFCCGGEVFRWIRRFCWLPCFGQSQVWPNTIVHKKTPLFQQEGKINNGSTLKTPSPLQSVQSQIMYHNSNELSTPQQKRRAFSNHAFNSSLDMPDNEMSVDMELSHWYAHVNNMASDTADGQSSGSHVNAEKKPPKYVAFF